MKSARRHASARIDDIDHGGLLPESLSETSPGPPSLQKLVLLLSANMLYPAWVTGMPVAPADTAPRLPIELLQAPQKQTGASSSTPGTGNLQFPPTLLEFNDSTFLRQLMLSHGVALDLSDPTVMDDSLELLLSELRGENALNRTVDFELLVADLSGEWTQLLANSHCPGSPLERVTQDGTLANADEYVSPEWRVTWLSGCDPEGMNPADIIDPDNLQQSEVTPSWKVTLLSQRPIAQSQPTPTPTPSIIAPPVSPGSVPENLRDSPAVDGTILQEGPSLDFDLGDEVPEGFESLAGPQDFVVDLFFNGRKMGTTEITVTTDTFIVNDPKAAGDLLNGVRDRALVVELLSQELPTNADKVCFGVNEPPGCGTVSPGEQIAAIYNEYELRLDVFLAAELQTVQALNSVRYLPTPDIRPASIVSVTALASESDVMQGDDNVQTDVSVRGLFGYGRGNLFTEVDYSSVSDRRRLREFKITHHLQDHELITGTYLFQPGAGLSAQPLLGLSFSTSLKSRVDLEHAFSSELVVYLPRRTIVQLVVDDRVYAGATYPAGNQVLDTTDLPDGTYPVEIRILDQVSGERTETRRFTKSTLIPPRDETLYRFTAGTPLLFNDNHLLPELVGGSVVGVSMSRRFTDQSAYRAGLLKFGSHVFLQAEFIYLGEDLSLQAASSLGDGKTLATSLRASWSINDFNANLAYQAFRSDVDTDDDAVEENLYPDEFDQINLSLSKSFNRNQIGIRSTYREELVTLGDTEVRNRSNQYAFYYRRPFLRRRNFRGFFDASYQQDEVDKRINLQVRFSASRPRMASSLTTDYRHRENGEDGFGVQLDAGLQSAANDVHEWEIGAHAEDVSTSTSYGTQLEYNHRWFSASTSNQWRRFNGGDTSQTSVAALSAHIGLDRNGAAFGGKNIARSGVIIDVDGQPEGARFDVMVNGIKVSSGKVGSVQFVGLQPFESYSITLVPQSIVSNGFGEQVYEFSLYPGNIQRIAIVARREVLLIATLVDQYGALIEDAVVEREPNPVLIESGGFFQSEVSPGEVLRVKPAVGEECEFTVPELQDDVSVLDQPILCSATVQ